MKLPQIFSGAFAKRASLLALVLLLARLAGPCLANEETAQFTSKEFLKPIKFLSSDKLKGRGDGTKELDEAARHIEKRFKEFGLRPAGDNGGYLQHFRITVGAQMRAENSVSYQNGETHKTLAAGHDFVPFSFSKVATVRAPLLFAGYGITA